MKTNMIIAALAAALVSGCTPYQEEQRSFDLHGDLEGCKVYKVSDGGAKRPIRVVRCPKMECNTTTYSSGKSEDSTAICE